MPYIPQDRRSDAKYEPRNAGELNYAISMMLVDYWRRNGERYQTINDVLGALEGAKLEFYRRIAVDHEERKRIQNGDIL